MSIRLRARQAVVHTLDALLGWSNKAEWVGNVQEVWLEISKRGDSWVSDYSIRKVLREKGESLGRGQYRITRMNLEKKS